MDQYPAIDNPSRDWVGAEEAATLLGVKRETLYAYVSRGLVRSAAARGTRERVYHREDLERLRTKSRARSGHAPVAASALRWGEPVLETRVGDIRADGPYYRGRSAIALATSGATFEEACSILWEAPFAAEPIRLGTSASHARALLPREPDPFDGMLVATAALAVAEPRSEATLEAARARAGTLVRRIVAAAGLSGGDATTRASIEQERSAAALLAALGAKTTTARVAAIDEALVLTADHELNASTFAARVAASAGASLPSSIVAALATASGPLHGAATARVEAFVVEVLRPERAAATIGARLDRGESIPGFGHPLYPGGDPRGTRLLEVAMRMAGKTRALRVISAVVDAMELVAREKPTVDVGLVALSAALGLPRGSPLAIFACGRLGGWIAHALEQRAAGFLLRPRARYAGT